MKRVLGRENLSGRQRDYLMLTAFVLARHGYLARALILVEALLALGDEGQGARFARALLRFLANDFVGALSDLDGLEADAAKHVRSVTPTVIDIHRYLRARCYCETGHRQEGEAMARTTYGVTLPSSGVLKS
ncbi:hypothetical protein PDO_4840 [Rhizobium sp. PDO1-076]|nr:hypothetical protein PDO_4840 [Rhizobium sp. PDO1-076]